MVFKSIFLDLYGPVGSLPFQVNGSNNTTELQAPLEAIAFMLLHPPLPPHIIFHLDSQYVIDLLLGLSLPSSNIELAILLLDFYHYLASRTYLRNPVVQNYCHLVKLIGFSSLNFETGVSPKNCYFTIVDLHLE